MFISGLLADRINKDQLRFLVGAAYFLQFVGIVAFLLNQTLAMFIVWYIFHYFGLGLGLPARSIMQARYFGRKSFGSIRGITMVVMMPFGVLAPIYAGWVHDTTGSYITAFTLFGALLASSTVIVALARPPKPPTQVSDIRKIV